jgi:hypothetical protein
MNQKKHSSNEQGKRPIIKKGGKYTQSLEALFVDGIRMSVCESLDVIEILNSEGIDNVVIGGIVVGCHSGRPRATQDLDIIVKSLPEDKVLKKIGKIVKSKRLEIHPSFISFIIKSVVGDREIVDLITSRAGSYGQVFDNYIILKINSISIKIPTIEMLVVLKYTAAVNPIRSFPKQSQDWADIYSIIDANRSINVESMIRMANDVVPGYGDDLFAKVKNLIR